MGCESSSPGSVISRRQAAGPNLQILTDDNGRPWKLPGNGGAVALVVVQWLKVQAARSGAVVLFGVSGAFRVPLAIAYFTAATHGDRSVPAFQVGGLPFDHYELEIAADSAATAGWQVQAMGIVSDGPAGSPTVRVTQEVSGVLSAMSAVTLPEAVSSRRWVDQAFSPDTSPGRFVAVTPNDATDLADGPTGWVYIGGAGATGTLKANDAAGNTVSFVGLTAGKLYRMRLSRIWAADTTCTNILAGYGD